MPKKMLMISSFPPVRCGIATYAQEEFLYYRSRGYIVHTLGLDDGSSANFNFNLTIASSLVKLTALCLVSTYDEVRIQFTNGLIWPKAAGNRLSRVIVRMLQYLWFLVLAWRYGDRFVVVAHEVELRSRDKWLSHRFEGFVWGQIRQILVHTQKEKDSLLQTYRSSLRSDRIKLKQHHEHMQPKFNGDTYRARQILGIGQTEIVFLCIGFIQRHKGFDTAIEAFSKIGDGSNRKLYVVGSMRVDVPEIRSYRDFLERQIQSVPGTRLIEEFVDDQAFDLWIKAVDYVVLPYHEIWSSGVGARAGILGTPVIYRKLPTLGDQFEQHSDFESHPFSTTAELSTLLGQLPAKITKGPSTQLVTEGLKPNVATRKTLSKKKLLFVMGIFGESVKGGAESFVLRLTKELTSRDADIEVWTTASKEINPRSNALWNDESDRRLNFKIRRFKTNCLSQILFDQVHRRMNRAGQCGLFLRWIWKKSNIRGLNMRKALEDEGHRFDVIHLFHYLHGTSHELAGIFPSKTILHPFIHDEAPLYNPLMRNLFSGVRGVTVNTPAEINLALKAQCGLLPSLYHPIGNGVEVPNVEPQKPKDFDPLKFGPYVVFVGRLIADKNLPELFDWHQRALDAGLNISLVCIGHGPMSTDPVFTQNPRFLILNWVSDAEKIFVLKHSLALVQLSKLESFSLVVMEAWLCQVPVIVHSACAATAGHVKISKGGYAVYDHETYTSALRQIQSDVASTKTLGLNGESYVQTRFNWDAVCNNYVHALAKFFNWNRESVSRMSELRHFSSPLALSSQTLIADQALGKDFYAKFEAKYRDPNVIPESWQHYLTNYLSALPGGSQVVDIGAGRGHFLSYLSQNAPHLTYFGVEPDLFSVSELRSKGLMACHSGMLQFTEKVQSESLDAATMLHVAEHVPWEILIDGLSEIFRVLKPKGLLILEFPNLWSLLTSGIYFWTDPTHLRPISPPALDLALRSIGFAILETCEFSPHLNPEEKNKLDHAIPHSATVKAIYGKQDFSIIAAKPMPDEKLSLNEY